MPQTVWIGTYTKSNSQGIYRAEFEEGQLKIIGAEPAENPSDLAFRGTNGYAVRETPDGALVSYRLDGDGRLLKIAEQKVWGDDPCHICLDGRRVYVSNYGSGSLAVFELDASNAASKLSRLIEHEKRMPEKTAHVHQSRVSPDGAMVAVCDLGCDGVAFYPRDEKGMQMPAQWVFLPEGAGPRHMVFGRDMLWYVLCELSCDLFAYRGYGKDAQRIQRISASRGKADTNAAAALWLSPCQTMLLASVRGEDTLVLWDILPDGGLSMPRHFDTHGKWPRDAVFSPDGRFVLCACEREDRVTIFRQQNGSLFFESSAAVPSPTRIVFSE